MQRRFKKKNEKEDWKMLNDDDDDNDDDKSFWNRCQIYNIIFRFYFGKISNPFSHRLSFLTRNTNL